MAINFAFDEGAAIRNKLGREAAERMLESIRTMIAASPPGQLSVERFWEVLATETCKQSGLVAVDQQSPDSMSDAEALDFERRLIPFGIHKDKKVGDVAIDYWWKITEDPFSRALRRYMRSKRFQERERMEMPNP